MPVALEDLAHHASRARYLPKAVGAGSAPGSGLRAVLNLLLLVLIVASVLYVAAPGGGGARVNVGPGGGSTLEGAPGVGSLAQAAVERGEVHAAAVRARVEEIRRSCAAQAAAVDVDAREAIRGAEKAVERYVNHSMAAWLEGDVRRLAVLYYAAWPLKEELRRALYRPSFNVTELYATACALNETLNRLDELASLAPGQPPVGVEDLEGLVEAWRHTSAYSVIFDVDKYGPRYMGVASKGPIEMLESALTYTLVHVEIRYADAIGACTLGATAAGIGEGELSEYREDVEAFFERVAGDPYAYMLFHSLLDHIVEDFSPGKVVERYKACEGRLEGLAPEDLAYVVFHEWLEYTGLIDLARG